MRRRDSKMLGCSRRGHARSCLPAGARRLCRHRVTARITARVAAPGQWRARPGPSSHSMQGLNARAERRWRAQPGPSQASRRARADAAAARAGHAATASSSRSCTTAAAPAGWRARPRRSCRRMRHSRRPPRPAAPRRTPRRAPRLSSTMCCPTWCALPTRGLMFLLSGVCLFWGACPARGLGPTGAQLRGLPVVVSGSGSWREGSSPLKPMTQSRKQSRKNCWVLAPWGPTLPT